MSMLKVYKVEHVKTKDVCLRYEVWIYDSIDIPDNTRVELLHKHDNGDRQLLACFDDCKDCREAYLIAMERLLMHAEAVA